MKARKEQIQMKVEHTQRAQAPPTSSQPIYGRWPTGQGYKRVWSGGGEKEVVYFGVLTQTSLGEMSCRDGISPKRSKNELEPLDACLRGR